MQKQRIEFCEREKKQRNDYCLLGVLRTKEGRAYIMHLLELSEVFSENFTGTERDAYYQGRRSVGLKILLEINSLGMEAVDFKLMGEREHAKIALEIDRLCSEYYQENGEYE